MNFLSRSVGTNSQQHNFKNKSYGLTKASMKTKAPGQQEERRMPKSVDMPYSQPAKYIFCFPKCLLPVISPDLCPNSVKVRHGEYHVKSNTPYSWLPIWRKAGKVRLCIPSFSFHIQVNQPHPPYEDCKSTAGGEVYSTSGYLATWKDFFLILAFSS